jgi:hypothetical protein
LKCRSINLPLDPARSRLSQPPKTPWYNTLTLYIRKILPDGVKTSLKILFTLETRRSFMPATHPNSLAVLADAELLRRLEALIRKEREITLQVLHYLVELERRQLYARLGYASLFEFCTRQLGCSESGANRRIRAARCIRDFPEVAAMLERGELDLSRAALLSGTLTDENQATLLAEVRGRSYR